MVGIISAARRRNNAAAASPTIVQYATATRSANIALPSAPTAGNFLLLMVATDSREQLSSAFTKLGATGSTSEHNLKAGVRKVQAGDSASYAIRSPNAYPTGSAVLYELSNVGGFCFLTGGLAAGFFSSGNYVIPTVKSPFRPNDVIFGGLNNVNTNAWVPDSQSNIAVDLNAVDTVGTFADCFFHTTGAIPNALTGSIGGTGPANANMQLIAAVSTGTAE